MHHGHFKHSLWHLNTEMYFQQLDQMLQTSMDLGTKKEISEVNHQKFLKEFFKESVCLLDWAIQVLTFSGKLVAQLNSTFESHQFACPCLNSKEEILLWEKHLQSPPLLVSGAYTSSGVLYPLSLRSGKQHIKILGLLSLELGVVTPGLLRDYFWHDGREIWSKNLKIACSIAKAEPF